MTLSAILFPRRSAHRDWINAKDRYEAAVRSRDTRAQHLAYEALRQATVRKLQVGA